MQIEDIHIGDEVRFLDSVGGGKVSRMDAKRKMVYVEDADGFELPTPLAQIVLVAPAEHTHIADTMATPTPRDLKPQPYSAAFGMDIWVFCAHIRCVSAAGLASPLL